MRLFVAVEIDPLVVAAVAECAEELRRRVAARSPRARITWVPAERLHVTVRFVGEVDEARAEVIASALKSESRVQGFELAIEGVGTFPERGAPRVFWAGLSGGIERLVELEAEVSARLEACGIGREERPYHPHVTLARVREASRLRPPALLEGLADRRFGVWPVSAITLFHSRPSPQGHVYAPLQRTPLGSGT